jgi:hypothetical protein
MYLQNKRNYPSSDRASLSKKSESLSKDGDQNSSPMQPDSKCRVHSIQAPSLVTQFSIYGFCFNFLVMPVCYIDLPIFLETMTMPVLSIVVMFLLRLVMPLVEQNANCGKHSLFILS